MSTVKNIDIGVRAFNKTEKPLDDAKKEVKTFGDSIKALGPVGVVAGVGLAAVAAAGAAVAYTGYQVASSLFGVAAAQAQAISDNSDLAQRLGVTTSALGNLQFAAKFAGIEAEGLNDSIAKFQLLQGQENDGMQKALTALGLSMEDIKGKAVDEQLAVIADAMQDVDSEADLAALSVSLFGKSGAAMGLLLKNGSDGLREAAEEAKLFGVSVSELDTGKVDAMNDNVDKLGFVWQGVGNVLAATVAPIITDITGRILEWVKASGGITGIFKKIGDTVGPTMHDLIGYFQVGATFALEFGKQVLNLASYFADYYQITEEIKSKLSGGWIGNTTMANGIRDGINASIKGIESAQKYLDKHELDSDLTKYLTNVTKKANEAAGSIKRLSNEEEVSAMKKAELAKIEEDLIKKLEAEKAAIGKSSHEAEIAKAVQDGISTATAERARQLAKEIEAEKESIKAKEKLAEEGKKVFEDTRTDLEKYAKGVEHLNELLKGGYIDQDTYTRGVAKLDEDLNKDKDKKKDKKSDKNFAEAVEFGSAESRSTILASLFDGGPQEATAKSTETIAKEAVKTNANWQRLFREQAQNADSGVEVLSLS